MILLPSSTHLDLELVFKIEQELLVHRKSKLERGGGPKITGVDKREEEVLREIIFQDKRRQTNVRWL